MQFLILAWVLLPSLSAISCPTNCFCTNYKTRCDRAKLNGVPHNPSNKTELLEINNDNITELRRELFQNKNLHTLNELILSGINASIVKDKAFQDLKNLLILSITKNNINSISSGAFTGLTNLTQLVLSQNKLRTLQSRLFEGLTSLRILDLTYNNVIKPDVEVFYGMLSKNVSRERHVLKQYILRMNHMTLGTVIPGIFKELDTFVVLNLHYNDITIILTNTFEGLIQLRYLYLHSNPLYAIEEGAFNNLSHLIYVEFRDTRLHTIHQHTFQSLASLNILQLFHCNITALNNKSFSELQSLTELHLGQNNIEEINPIAFQNIKELGKIDLQNNKINFAEDFTFPGLPFLQELNLEKNKIQLLSLHVFHKLPALRTLHLQENLISQIEPQAFREQTLLKFLDLSKNKIKILEKNTFFGLSTLEKLVLNNNDIISIDANTFDGMEYLVNLLLNSNNISHLENGTFRELNRLKVLSLDGNNLLKYDSRSFKGIYKLKILTVSLPSTAEFSSLVGQIAREIYHIEHLTLTGVTSIQKGDFDQLRVTKLDLSNNNIGILQSEIFQGIVDVEILDLYECQIHTISKKAFRYLSGLKNLYMIYNLITHIEADTFEDLRSLELLNIAYNKISGVSSDVFRNNVNLITLRLDGNLFVNISDHFINAPSLQELSLKSCEISSISALAFSGVPNLITLDISDNNLESLDIETFKYLEHFNAILMKRNPMVCDCNLKEIWELYGEYEEQVPFLLNYCPNSDQDWYNFFSSVECNLTEYRSYYHNEEFITEFKAFRQYVEPTMLGVMFLIGVIGNVLLIIIFSVHPEIRSIPNAPILNLTIADLLSLIFNLALSFADNVSKSWTLGLTLCKLFMTVRDLVVGVSVYSVVALCLQRYSATLHMSSQRRLCGLSDKVMIIVFIVGVWVLAFFFALPTFLSATVETRCRYVSSEYSEEYIGRTWTIQLMVYCVVPASVVVIFYYKTARQLKESVKNFPGEMKAASQIQKRLTSANMALGLTAMFCISYGPNFFIRVLTSWSVIDSQSTAVSYLSFGTYFLFFWNTCFNPVALYHMSTAFRKLFRKYIFFWRDVSSAEEHHVMGRQREPDIPLREMKQE